MNICQSNSSFQKVSVARLQVQQERSNAKSKLEEEKHHWVYGWWTSWCSSWNRHIYTVVVAIHRQCVKGIDNISYQWLAQHSTLPRIEATTFSACPAWYETTQGCRHSF